MRITKPPEYPEFTVHPDFTQDAAHNRREMDVCAAAALALDCTIRLPTGEWLIGPPVASL